MQNVEVTPVVGLPKFNGWSQVVLSTDRKLIVLLSVSGANAHNIGQDLTDTIKAAGVTDAASLHQLFLDLSQTARDKGGEVSLTGGLLSDNWQILATNNGAVILKRLDKTGVIISSQGSLKIIEGKSYPDDALVFLSAQAANFLEEINQKLSQGLGLDIITTSLVTSLHLQPDSSLSAVALVRFDLAADEPETVTAMAPARPLSAPLSLPTLPKLNLKPTKDLAAKISANLPVSFDFKMLNRKTKRLAVSSILIVGLIAGLLAAYLLNLNWQKQAVIKQAADKVSLMEEAHNLAGTDPILAREKLSEAILNLEKLKETLGTKVAKNYLNAQLEIAKQYYQDISGREEFKELPIFWDLRSVESDLVATKAKNYGEAGMLIDQDKKLAVAINLTDKNVQTHQLSGQPIIDITKSEKYWWFLGGGVQSLATSSASASAQVAMAEDDGLKEAKLVSNFGSYLYVFNPEKRNIFRYVIEGSKLGAHALWLKSSQGLDFTQVSSMAIDGDIYLATKNGEIKKFTSGSPVDFQVQGLADQFSGELILVTNDNLDNLYILEPGKYRLVVLNKEGKFVREVKSAALAAATGLMVDEKLKKIFLVSGSLIFEVGI